MCKVLKTVYWHILSTQVLYIIAIIHFISIVANYRQDIERLGIFFSYFLDVNELKECLSVLVKEQQALAIQSATTTLSALRLKQRLVILERYFIALNRTVFQENVKVKWKSSSISLPPVDKKR